MKYAVCYESRTGNTAMLAERIRQILPEEDCVYFGVPEAEALKAEWIFVGFWTDKGTCPEKTADFLSGLSGKKVFFFGTAGFGESAAYFEQIMERVRTNLPEDAAEMGHFLCQGKMPQAVADRYEAMEDSPRRTMMLENFKKALSHPNEEDLAALEGAVRGSFGQ
ncbi:hypothetical protein H9X85_07765 [Anaerotignum lactatifermentans]|uniref:Flavodoxin-like domain-containing protein n=1 Tax=Anaerotignum lactatifermentans TaxID=160404 RepID=A0ABS2GBT2_9FIRM|nr:flavodoxin family protein BilS [Anaerotignum lactatifermentans]MBM6829573.1 hypothetical protein [Anaerotignum lactatifermentans]MBM6878067.1 hypothetical protein [Anaerotignum lactatifermentans]MBM6951103.1 hypothetical protein [Anaerotignum lactatifermentans]